MTPGDLSSYFDTIITYSFFKYAYKIFRNDTSIRRNDVFFNDKIYILI